MNIRVYLAKSKYSIFLNTFFFATEFEINNWHLCKKIVRIVTLNKENKTKKLYISCTCSTAKFYSSSITLYDQAFLRTYINILVLLVFYLK